MHDIAKFLNNWSPMIQALSAVAIATLTFFYVRYTKRLLNESTKANRLSSEPFLQLTIQEIAASVVLKQKCVLVDLALRNLGRSPALNVRIDAVVECSEFAIPGDKTFPRGYFPCLDKTESMIPVIAADETCTPEIGNRPYFEQQAAHHIQDAWIVYDPSKSGQKSPCCLNVYLYYSNSIGELYETTYSSLLLPILSATGKDLGKDKLGEVQQLGYKTQQISKEEMHQRIKNRRHD